MKNNSKKTWQLIGTHTSQPTPTHCWHHYPPLIEISPIWNFPTIPPQKKQEDTLAAQNLATQEKIASMQVGKLKFLQIRFHFLRRKVKFGFTFCGEIVKALSWCRTSWTWAGCRWSSSMTLSPKLTRSSRFQNYIQFIKIFFFKNNLFFQNLTRSSRFQNYVQLIRIFFLWKLSFLKIWRDRQGFKTTFNSSDLFWKLSVWWDCLGSVDHQNTSFFKSTFFLFRTKSERLFSWQSWLTRIGCL